MNATSSPNRLHKALDAVMYVATVTALAFLVALVLAALFDGDLSAGVVRYTFVFGFLILGYGTLQLRPSAAWRKERSEEVEEDVELARTDTDESGESISPRDQTRFQATVQRLPPLRRYSVPPDERLPVALKMFLSGLAVWLTSMAIDVFLNGAFR